MLQISITFGTPSNPEFQWIDSLEHLTDEELHEFAVQSRSATAAFFTEISDRSNPRQDETLEEYHKTLQENANQINRKGLTDEYETYLDNLNTYLAGPSNARSDIKVVRQFLWLVSRVIGWSYALLLFCALGKHRLQKLDEYQRTKLVKHIAQHRDSLFCPILQDKAVCYDLHQLTFVDIKVDPPFTRGCKKRKRKGGEETATGGTAPARASLGNVTVFHSNTDSHRPRSATHSYPIAPETHWLDTGGTPQQNGIFADDTQGACAIANNRPSLAERSVNGSDKDPERDVATYNPPLPHRPPAKPHSPSHSKTRRKPPSPFSLTSQEHESSLPNSNTGNDDDKNANSTVPGSDIDCGAIVEPQKQIAAFNYPSPRLRSQLQDYNWSPATGAVLKDAGSPAPICEDGIYKFDAESHTKPATYLSAPNTKERTLPDAEVLSILRDNNVINVTPGSGGTIENSGQIEPAINIEHSKPLANDSRSNSAVCFNQQLAQPVVVTTAGANIVVPGPDAGEVDSVSAVRSCHWIHQPMLKLAQDGLIKVQSNFLGSNPVSLQDFYVRSICAGRTLLKDNAYLQEVLPIANYDAATKYAMTALTLSYYKEYLPDENIQKERMVNGEVEAIARTITALKQNTRNGHVYGDTAKMLLIYHAILNQGRHSARWTDYLYQLQDSRGRQSNLIVATHSVLLMTLLPLDEKHQFQKFDYDWIGRGEQYSLTKVNGILGMSRKMLYFQYLIITAAKFPKTVENGNLLCDIEGSYQWLDITETEMAMRIALKTAETYKLATRLYALARLCRFTPSHPDVRAICNRLTRELCELPVSGAEYSGLHPAWCFAIACACTEDPDEYTKMDRILDFIGGANKSNVSDLLRLVRWIWAWKMDRQLSGEWWEDMTDYLDSMMNGNLICVT